MSSERSFRSLSLARSSLQRSPGWNRIWPRIVVSRVRTCRRSAKWNTAPRVPGGGGSNTPRRSHRIAPTRSPSGAAITVSESATAPPAGGAGPAAAANAPLPSPADSARTLAALAAQPLTRQLRFARVRVALDQILERFLGGVVLAQLLARESQLVERSRHAIAGRPAGLDLSVLDRGAVEP